jgi:hypothetical protein
VELRIDGFSHKLPALARRVVECVAKCEVRDPDLGSSFHSRNE